MNLIPLNAGSWTTPIDFYDALLRALGAPTWHGQSVAAVIDSVVWNDLNEQHPPYKIVISNMKDVPETVLTEVKLLKDALSRARTEHSVRQGRDVEVLLDFTA